MVPKKSHNDDGTYQLQQSIRGTSFPCAPQECFWILRDVLGKRQRNPYCCYFLCDGVKFVRLLVNLYFFQPGRSGIRLNVRSEPATLASLPLSNCSLILRVLFFPGFSFLISVLRNLKDSGACLRLVLNIWVVQFWRQVYIRDLKEKQEGLWGRYS